MYTSVPTIALAATGLRLVGRHAGAARAAVSAVVCLLLAGTALYAPLMVVPGLSLGAPVRLLFLAQFSIIALASLSLDEHVRAPAIRASATAAGMLLTAAWILRALTQSVEGRALLTGRSLQVLERPDSRASLDGLYDTLSPVVLRPAILVPLTCVILLILAKKSDTARRIGAAAAVIFVAADLATFLWAFNTRSLRSAGIPETPGIHAVRSAPDRGRVVQAHEVFLHNALSLWGVDDAAGYSSFYPRRAGLLLWLTQAASSERIPSSLPRWMTPGFEGPLLDLLGVTHVLLPPGTLEQTSLPPLYRGEIDVGRNPTAMPHAFFVDSAIVAANEGDAVERLRTATREELRGRVILEDMAAPPNRAAGSHGLVVQEDRTTDTLSLTVQAQNDGWVVVAESWDSGWRATLDGVDVPVLRANLALQAVAVPAGTHLLELRYQPVARLVALAIGNVTWVLLGGALLVLLRRRGGPLPSTV